MKFIRCIFYTFILIVIAGTSAYADVILLSDNFNAEHGTSGIVNYNNFANWTVTGGTVDLIGNGYFDFLPGNGLYLDLDGSTGQAGVLTSKASFTFMPGVSYKLQFDLAGSHTNSAVDTVDVSILGISSASFILQRNDPFGTREINFTVPSQAVGAIAFHNLGGDNMGALLDNVILSSDPAPVPEPSTMILLGFGLIGLTACRLRKSAKV